MTRYFGVRCAGTQEERRSLYDTLNREIDGIEGAVNDCSDYRLNHPFTSDLRHKFRHVGLSLRKIVCRYMVFSLERSIAKSDTHTPHPEPSVHSGPSSPKLGQS